MKEGKGLMGTEFRSEIGSAPNGARVEIATITHEGRDFTALGSVVDHARGFVVGYVTRDEHGPNPSTYRLTTWEGTTIAPLRLVNTWEQYGFYGARVRHFAWRAVIDGRTYSGRNSGPGMLLRMRAR